MNKQLWKRNRINQNKKIVKKVGKKEQSSQI